MPATQLFFFHLILWSGLECIFAANSWVVAMDSQTDSGNWWGFLQTSWWWQSQVYSVLSSLTRVYRDTSSSPYSNRGQNRRRGLSSAGVLNCWGDRMLTFSRNRTFSHALTAVSYPACRWFFCHPLRLFQTSLRIFQTSSWSLATLFQGYVSSFLGGIDWFDDWAFGLEYQELW